MSSTENAIEALKYMSIKMQEEAIRIEQELKDIRERIASTNCQIKLLEYIKEQDGRTTN